MQPIRTTSWTPNLGFLRFPSNPLRHSELILSKPLLINCHFIQTLQHSLVQIMALSNTKKIKIK